jgi:GNAT superfamily N-acetyltransferase
MVGMDLTWLDLAHLDERDLAGAAAVMEAARAVDSPQFPAETLSFYRAWVRHGWDGHPATVGVARDRSGRVTGVLSYRLPSWDNTHLAPMRVVVDPPARLRGLGRQLLEVGLDRVRDAGRRLAVTWTFDGTPGVDFLKAVGFDPALPAIHRRQDLCAVDWSALDREYAAAESRAAGYELVRMPGRVPEELLQAVAAMTEAINDAPTDNLDFEDEVFTPERIRGYEAAQDAYRRRLYRLVARERSTGEFAGHTLVAVESERPWYAGQHDTSVLRAHRGHRLGLLLKIGMVRWLREAEPQLRYIETDNAESNAHMIRVNEILGYEVIGKTIEYQRHLPMS